MNHLEFRQALLFITGLVLLSHIACSPGSVDSGYQHDAGQQTDEPDSSSTPNPSKDASDKPDALAPDAAAPRPDAVDPDALTLSDELLYVPRAANSATLQVYASAAWTAHSDADWVEISGEAIGSAGAHEITLSIQENTSDERRARVYFSQAPQAPVALEIVQENGARDHIYATPDGEGDGYSWGDPTTFERALSLARSGQTIHLSEGVYTPQRAITGGSSSAPGDRTFEIAENITLIGGYPAGAEYDAAPNPAEHTTLLSGDGSAHHVLTIWAPAQDGEKVTARGLAIRDGANRDADTDTRELGGRDFPQNVGAGVIVGASTLELIDVEIANNHAGRAAAIYAFDGASLTLKRAKINHNASEELGGAIWARDAATLRLHDSQVRDNESGAIAGGVYIYDNSTAQITNTIIADNISRTHGAGLYLRQQSRATLLNSIISHNTTNSGTGAGIFLYDDSNLNIVSSTVTRNYSHGEAGGIYLRKGANQLKVYNSLISGNSQANGSKEVDQEADNTTSAKYQASVVQKTIYDANGQETGTNFDPDDALLYFKWGFYGVDNTSSAPASAHAMEASALADLSAALDPPPAEELLKSDLLGQARADQPLMGALLNQDPTGIPAEELFFPAPEKVRALKRFDFISRTYYFITRVRQKDQDGNLLKLRHAQAKTDAGETVPDFARRMGNPLVAINASMGLSDQPSGVTLPTGVQIIDGDIIHDRPRNKRHTLGIKDDNKLIFYPPNTAGQDILDDDTSDALTAFTALIVDHTPVDPDIMTWVGNYVVKHPRQSIAQTNNLDLLLLSCGGRGYGGEGMLAEDLIRILSEHDVRFAFMLDGGGSTSTVINGELITEKIDGQGTKDRARPNFLYVSE